MYFHNIFFKFIQKKSIIAYNFFKSESDTKLVNTILPDKILFKVSFLDFLN